MGLFVVHGAQAGGYSPVAALAVSSTIVDVSPFSTNGALMLANRPDTISEEKFYKQILGYCGSSWPSARCSSGPRSSCRAGAHDPRARSTGSSSSTCPGRWPVRTPR